MKRATKGFLHWLSDPRLLELLAAIGAFGYGLAWLISKYADFPRRAVSTMHVFDTGAPVLAGLITLAGILGVVTTVKHHRLGRAFSAAILFLSFSWYSTSFLFVAPSWLLQIYIYMTWSLMEGIIFLRVYNNLSGDWE